MAHTWSEFEAKAPDFATAARRLFVGDDGVAIGFLATGTASRGPHLSPVCPIFAGTGLYLSAVTRSPKTSDLRVDPHYALHAFLGPSDEEFQLRGTSVEVTDSAERDAVHQAIAFGSYDASHPVFHFEISSALWVHWENPGQPDTRAVRRRWSETV